MVFCALATAARAGWLFAFSWNADVQLWAWPALPGEELKAGAAGGGWCWLWPRGAKLGLLSPADQVWPHLSIAGEFSL